MERLVRGSKHTLPKQSGFRSVRGHFSFNIIQQATSRDSQDTLLAQVKAWQASFLKLKTFK